MRDFHCVLWLDILQQLAGTLLKFGSCGKNVPPPSFGGCVLHLNRTMLSAVSLRVCVVLEELQAVLEWLHSKLLVACRSEYERARCSEGANKAKGLFSCFAGLGMGTVLSEEVSSISWCLLDISWIIFTHLLRNDPHRHLRRIAEQLFDRWPLWRGFPERRSEVSFVLNCTLQWGLRCVGQMDCEV